MLCKTSYPVSWKIIPCIRLEKDIFEHDLKVNLIVVLTTDCTLHLAIVYEEPDYIGSILNIFSIL